MELAGQMQALEEKLGTLRDGTEAVGLVLGNWEGVLRAITLAAGRLLCLWGLLGCAGYVRNRLTLV